MSPELRWLIDCLQALARGETPPVPRESIDWAQLLATAEAEALAPALGFAFKTGPPAGMPPTVAARLHRHLVDATARHVIVSIELGRLLKVLKREGIPVMPLKGPVLAETLYRHPALRPYTDLDLLIPRDAVVRVDDHLHRLGYRRLADAHSFAFDIAYDRATLYETTSGVHVDLHWGLLSEPRYSWNERDAEGIWERAVPIRVAGEEALGLCPEDLLLYLTAHLAVHHALAGVLWFYDLYLLLERGTDTLDWRAAHERAARWRVRTALYFGLHEVQKLFGARVPRELMAAVKPRGPRAAVMAFLLRSRAPAQRRALEHVIAVLLVDRGRDVLRALGRILLPSSDWLQARYGAVATSRFGSYRAHYRRLGQVMSQAARGLRPPRR